MEEYKVYLMMKTPDVKYIEESTDSIDDVQQILDQWVWVCEECTIDLFRKQKDDNYDRIKHIVIRK